MRSYELKMTDITHNMNNCPLKRQIIQSPELRDMVAGHHAFESTVFIEDYELLYEFAKVELYDMHILNTSVVIHLLLSFPVIAKTHVYPIYSVYQVYRKMSNLIFFIHSLSHYVC